MYRALKSHVALRVASAIALALLSACGGGSDVASPPVVIVPPDVARVWSASQVSATSLASSVAVTAHADACGGVSVVGINGTNWVAQRFSPKSGWQAPQTLVPSSAGHFQRLDVDGVPHFFYRDSKNWVRGALDCASNTWALSVAFPVEYWAAQQPDLQPVAFPVTASETFEHTLLAATVLSDNNTIALRELRSGAWSAATTMKALNTAASGSAPVSYLSGLSVVRARDGDAALLDLGLAGRTVAFRAKSAGDFAVISDTRGCLGHFCLGYANYYAPRLELDGSATTFFGDSFGVVKPDWFRTSATGMQSLLASSTELLFYEANTRLIRADGTTQWIANAASTPDAAIYENAVAASWTNTASWETWACKLAACRAFSQPNGDHLATIMSPGDTPYRSPYIAISDRTGSNRWEGSFTRSLVDVWAVGPNATITGNGSLQLLTYRATANSEIIVATVTSTRSTGETDVTPFALWK